MSILCFLGKGKLMQNPSIPYKITNSCGYNIFQWTVYFVERMTPPIIMAVPRAIVRVKGSFSMRVEAIIVTSGTR